MSEQPSDRVRDVLERVADALGLDAQVSVTETADGLDAQLDGDELGLVIGRHGQTIDALQHLCYRIAYRGHDQRKRVTVDAGGYRERRSIVLRHDADVAASAALRDGRPVALDAMNAVERRVVHEYLRDRTEVETYSEGEEPDRHLVVAPVVPS